MATATNQTEPAAVRPIPLAKEPASAESAALKNCSGQFGKCRWSFKPGSGFVPDLVTLYEQVRGTNVNPRYPLTRSEVLAQELCYSCAHDRRFTGFGMRTFPTAGTLQLMESWAKVEAERRRADMLSKVPFFAQRLYGPAEPPHKHTWIDFREPVAKPFVNQTFDKFARPVVDESRPKYRDHHAERQHFQLLRERKKAPTAEEVSETPRKKKRGKKSKGGDRGGGKRRR